MSTNPAWRGVRCIRVSLEFGARGVKLGGLTMLDSPTVQRPVLEGSHVAQVLVDGRTTVIQAFDDPRLIRGASGPEAPGHSYLRADHAKVYVKVPLPEGWSGGAIQIRVVDLSRHRRRPVDPAGLQKLLEGPAAELRIVADLGPERFHAHPDWARLGLAGGAPAESTGHYAIYADRAGKYRWRLIDEAGRIVANGGQGFATRAACEAELRWIRERGAEVPIRSLDLE